MTSSIKKNLRIGRVAGAVFATGLTLAGFATPVVADEAPLSEDRVRELVLETIRQNPEIITEAVELLQARSEAEQVVAARETLTRERDRLERDPNAPVLGNPDGDVTVVEFFDYNCPYCKQVADEVKVLLERDPDVRLVYREWPILGEGSVFAARAALAARRQGAYEEMHWALMEEPRVEEASVLRVAADLGLDLDRLREDMEDPAIEEHIRTSFALTDGLGFSGTPSFVIGEELVPGMASVDALQASVARARERDETR